MVHSREPTGGSRPWASGQRTRRGRSLTRNDADHADAADAADAATRDFVAHRNLLFTVAYEMLGSAADAEDVLQETWLRWAGVDLGTVRDPRAHLVRITTRQALGRLRTLRRRKESYVGPWLPEPLLTAPDVAEDVAPADSMSMAMLLVLETLAPTERAVFVLREVFDLPYDEIARPSARPPPRPAGSRTGPGGTSPPAARAGPRPRPRPAARCRRSSGRSRRATCNACSTSSRPTWCSWAMAAVSPGRR
ncbi:sigma factor [Actinomadura sp. LOL_016]|uniref:sigma factor n=1 Tax=unclassified Actinomadura TaxID=2626254 RepID=UPI003A7FEE65